MNGKIGLACGIVAGVAIIGALLFFAFAPVEDDSPERDTVRTQRQKEKGRPSAKKNRFAGEAVVEYKGTDKAKKSGPRMKVPEDWFAKLPSATDRAIAKRIQDAQDSDDRDAVFAAAEEALGSKSAEVRQAAVEALSLQGEAAIQPLLKFVGDADKDVADSAYWAWDDAADGLEGDLAKLGAVKEVIAVAQNEGHVKSAVGKIESMDTSRAIRELAKLARDGGKAAEAAKESYENVTGEPFENWAAAELKAIAIDHENRKAESE